MRPAFKSVKTLNWFWKRCEKLMRYKTFFQINEAFSSNEANRRNNSSTRWLESICFEVLKFGSNLKNRIFISEFLYFTDES